MQKTKIAIFTLLLFVFVVVPLRRTSAQTLSGTWKANDWETNWKHKEKNDDDDPKKAAKDSLNLNFRYERSGSNWNHGSNYEYKDIQGLSKEQVNGSNVPVKFRIVREAGTIECEGTFDRGKGSGSYRFTANPTFVSAMQSRGFNFSEEKLMSAASIDLTVAFVDDIRSAGFKNLDTNDLFKARIFKIDSAFMKEMAATGFPDLDMEDLVKARIFKIDAQFVKEVTAMGFAKGSLEDLVKLRIFKVTPEFLREMKAEGLSNISPEQATKLMIFKVTPEFVREVKAEGLSNLSVEELVKLRIFKVDGAYIRKVKEQRKDSLDVEELVKMKIFGRYR